MPVIESKESETLYNPQNDLQVIEQAIDMANASGVFKKAVESHQVVISLGRIIQEVRRLQGVEQLSLQKRNNEKINAEPNGKQ